VLNRLLRDHAVMRDRGNTLLALLDQSEPPPSDVLADARWRLSSYIMQHLALEDRHLYTKLLSDDRPHVQATGRRFQAELADLFSGFAESAQQWTPERISADWDTFRSMARIRLMKMYARINSEEAELFPLVYHAEIDVSAHGLPSHNWTRDAFSIKDAIVNGSGRAG
jgi:hypothetical protein